MQDRLRGKTNKQQPQQKKGTKLENFKTEKISNIKLLAVKEKRWALDFTVSNRQWWSRWNFCLGLPRQASMLLRSILQQTLEVIRKMRRIPSDQLTLAKLHSNLCGLYCLYLVHYLVRKPFNVYKLQKNPTLMQTTEIDIVRFFNEHVEYSQFKYRTW